MKKKLIQILMLLVATVSVGSFVSCKDTNEDLYNELRTQAIDQNASLQDALDQQTAALNDLLAKFNALKLKVDGIKSCECDEAAMQAEIDDLKTKVATLRADLDGLDIDDIDGLRDALNALQAELNGVKGDVSGLTTITNDLADQIGDIKDLIALLQGTLAGKVDQATLDAIIGGLTAQIDNIKTGLKTLEDQNLLALISAEQAFSKGLETRIASLEALLAGLKSAYDDKFTDILQRLAKAEQAIIDNKAWVEQQLADMNGDIATAQTTANNALTLAGTANTNAELALAEAKRIEGLANAAQAAADKAQGDADDAKAAAAAAQSAADLAYQLAAKAFETANKVNDLAVVVATLTGRVDANEQAIADLKQKAKDLQDLINANYDKLDTAIKAVNKDLEDKIDALKDVINGKLDDLKSELEGKIDNTNERLTNEVLDLLAKIKEVSDAVKDNASDIKVNAEKIANNAANIKANADAIDKIQDELKTINDNITLATTQANAAYKEASEAKAKAETNEKDIADLKVLVGVNKNNIEKLEKAIDELKEAVKDLKDKAAQIDINTTKIEGLTKSVEEAKGTIKDLADKYDELKTQLGDLRKELAEAKAKCEENLTEAKGYVESQIAALEATIVKYIADELNNYYDKDDINKILEGYAKASDLNGVATIDDLNKIKDELKDLATKSELAEVKGDLKDILDKLGGLVTKDELKELKDELKDAASKSDLDKLRAELLDKLSGVASQADLDKLKEDMKDLQGDMSDLQDDLSDLSKDFYDKIIQLYKDMYAGDKANSDEVQAVGDKLYDLAQRVAANEQAIEDIDKVLQTMHERMNNMDERFVNRDLIWAWLQDLYKTLNAKIAAVDGKVDGLKDELKKELADLVNKELPDVVVEILKGDTFNFITKDDLEDLVDKIVDDKIDPDKFAEALEDLTKLKARVKALEDGTVKLGDYNVDKKNIMDAIGDANNKIGDLQKAVKAINDKLPTMEKDIKDLKADVKAAQDKLDEIEPKVKALRDDVDAIQAFLGQQITGITIQGTYNPMFGSFSIPANIQSNILVAYYGRPSHAVEFPTTDDANYIRKDEVLTAEDWAMISDVEVFTQKKNKALMNAKDGKANAGKIYVTVNPTSTNAAGLNLDIVNTRDEVSLVTLTPLKKSGATLEFGFTRGASNGFYEADAYIESGKLDDVDGLEFEETKLQAIADEARKELAVMAKQFLTGDGDMGGNLGNIAVKVYQLMRDLKLEQKGLKAPFKDVDGNDQAVYSQYNLAATAIKPLTLNSLKFLEDYETIPGYEDARDFLLNDISKSLKDYIHVFFEDFDGSWRIQTLRTLSFDGVTLLDAAENLITRWAVRLSKFELNGNGYTFDIPANGTVDVMFDKDLTNGGTPVTIPEAVAYDKTKCNANRTTLVISGDLTDGLKTYLVLPAKGDDGVVCAYATVELTDTKADCASGVITVTDNKSATYDVASFDGTAIGTTGYVATLVLDNLKATEGAVDVPVVTTISDELKNLLEGQRDVLKTLSDLTVELNDFLDKIRNYETVIGDDIDQFLKKYLITYLDKINHTTTYFFHSINRRFGPFLTASNDSKGFKILSTTKYEPTVMDAAGLKFYPTTKNLELIVPLARKHVAVTDVYVDDGTLNLSAQKGSTKCVNALKKANTNDEFNTVLDGTERCIQVSKMEPGYIYEVAYSILDFEGNISTKKYYIKVK